MSVAGEYGAELIQQPSGSRVVPHSSVASELRGKQGSAAPGGMTVEFTGDTSGAFASAFMQLGRTRKIIIRQSQIQN